MQGASAPPGTEPSAALWATLPVPACCHPVVTAHTLPPPLVSGAARTLLPRADGAQGRVYPPGPVFLSLIRVHTATYSPSLQSIVLLLRPESQWALQSDLCLQVGQLSMPGAWGTCRAGAGLNHSHWDPGS